MMKHEFEALAGYEVSTEDYNKIIEPMYMAIPDVTKQEFVKMIDKKRFALKTSAQLKREMRKIADHLHEICGRYRDFDAEDALDALAREYAERFCGYRREDLNWYYYFEKGFEYPDVKRGCTYPETLVVANHMGHVSEVILQV